MEFLNLTPGEYKPIFEEGLRKQRLPYEVMRLQTVPLVNIHLPKNKQVKNHKKMFTFPWDHEYKKKKNEEFQKKEIDWEELDRKYGKLFKKN